MVFMQNMITMNKYEEAHTVLLNRMHWVEDQGRRRSMMHRQYDKEVLKRYAGICKPTVMRFSPRMNRGVLSLKTRKSRS
jgi:hypothetical protein